MLLILTDSSIIYYAFSEQFIGPYPLDDDFGYDRLIS